MSATGARKAKVGKRAGASAMSLPSRPRFRGSASRNEMEVSGSFAPAPSPPPNLQQLLCRIESLKNVRDNPYWTDRKDMPWNQPRIINREIEDLARLLRGMDVGTTISGERDEFSVEE